MHENNRKRTIKRSSKPSSELDEDDYVLAEADMEDEEYLEESKPKRNSSSFNKKRKSAATSAQNAAHVQSSNISLNQPNISAVQNNIRNLFQTQTQPQIPKGVYLMEPSQEEMVLDQLESLDECAQIRYRRLRARLAVRRIKRRQSTIQFDIDKLINSYIKTCDAPMPFDVDELRSYPSLQKSLDSIDEEMEDDKEFKVPQHSAFRNPLDPSVEPTPYENSFASLLYGHNTRHPTSSFISTFTGKVLPAFIFRDFSIRPRMKEVLEDIRQRAGQPKWKNRTGDATEIESDSVNVEVCSSTSTHEHVSSFTCLETEPDSIDYVYFQKQHTQQVNDLLNRLFWPGIDISEALSYPDFTCVALYRRLVVGCAFASPSGYITYFAVSPGWEGCGIGSFLLWKICNCFIGDVMLHVRADNRAMLLYQKFGFKPEEFIVGFYDKYLSPESDECKNAVLMRLRRR